MSETFDFVKEGAVNLYQFRICSSRGTVLHALCIYFKPFPLIGPSNAGLNPMLQLRTKFAVTHVLTHTIHGNVQGKMEVL
jgi:hypothetical protein